MVIRLVQAVARLPFLLLIFRRLSQLQEEVEVEVEKQIKMVRLEPMVETPAVQFWANAGRHQRTEREDQAEQAAALLPAQVLQACKLATSMLSTILLLNQVVQYLIFLAAPRADAVVVIHLNLMFPVVLGGHLEGAHFIRSTAVAVVEVATRAVAGEVIVLQMNVHHPAAAAAARTLTTQSLRMAAPRPLQLVPVRKVRVLRALRC